MGRVEKKRKYEKRKWGRTGKRRRLSLSLQVPIIERESTGEGRTPENIRRKEKASSKGPSDLQTVTIAVLIKRFGGNGVQEGDVNGSGGRRKRSP